eukprot:TRINITY_DN21081_c1_g1_i1.p1 TRINITY_DN21081_c1_g1~~TRINITY_DN21081_c1_g1_i1.p1  ORF type:complete len:103 (+),score=6.27 TRINITY_DN21081_c1_g1_i1:126-434(+)
MEHLAQCRANLALSGTLHRPRGPALEPRSTKRKLERDSVQDASSPSQPCPFSRTSTRAFVVVNLIPKSKVQFDKREVQTRREHLASSPGLRFGTSLHKHKSE